MTLDYQTNTVDGARGFEIINNETEQESDCEIIDQEINEDYCGCHNPECNCEGIKYR